MVCPEKNQATTSGDSITECLCFFVFSGGRASLISGENTELNGQIWGFTDPASSGSSHMFKWQFSGPLSFPVHALTLTVHSLQGWEFNLCCNSATYWRRCWVCFLRNPTSAATGDKSFFQEIHRNFQIIWAMLEHPWFNPPPSPLCSVPLEAANLTTPVILRNIF